MCSANVFVVCIIAMLFSVLVITNGNPEERCGSDEPSGYCLLRIWPIYNQLWNYYAGFFCYNYTDVARLWYKYNYSAQPILCKNKWISVPVAIINATSGLTSFYDYTNDTAMDLIARSFKTRKLFNNFLRCCKEAAYCCQNEMNNNNIYPNATHCPAVWDAWTCFPPTHVNTTARKQCSSQAYQSPESVCKLESEKYCTWNQIKKTAVWEEQTNYGVCAVAPVYRKRHRFHVHALSVCTAFCIPAIIIFFCYEDLRKNTRVILHRNLLIAICVRNILTILSESLVILDALKSSKESNFVMENNSVACRVLSFFENSAKNCIYAGMVLDGFYLHKVIVRAFAKEIKIIYFYIVLSVFTLVPSLIWATVMGINGMENCWMVDNNGYQWIVDSFRICILITNTFLLVDILRVMCTKLKKKSTSKQTKSALRATLFLIPLFGIHIMVTAKKITYDDSCTAEDYYDYTRYAMEALQGICVALLFCYLNSEVHDKLKNNYRKYMLYVQQRFEWKFGRKHTDKRRTTTATYVQPEGEY